MDLWRISNYSDSQGGQRQTDKTTPGAAGNVCVVKRPEPDVRPRSVSHRQSGGRMQVGLLLEHT